MTITDIWNTIFTYPILNVMLVFYHLCGDNLGIAIIVIAIITRLLMIPLTKKQTAMTRKMAGLKPQLDELKIKYGNNPQKLSEEQTKLYKKSGYNPLGCLGTLVPQLVVLSVLIVVIRNVTNNQFVGVYDFVKEWAFGSKDVFVNTTFLFWDLARPLFGKITDPDSLSKIAEFIQYSPSKIVDLFQQGIIPKETMNIIYKYGIFNQYGIKSIYTIAYIVLTALVGVTQYITTIFTQKMQNPVNVVPEKKKLKKKGEQVSPEALQGQMTKSMNLILPLSTVFIAVSASSALSLYWIVQSLMLVVQYWILDWDKTKKGVQNLYTKYFKKSK